jgi:hypothetical protein
MNNLTPSESTSTHSETTHLEPSDEAELPKRLDRRGVLQFGGAAALAGTAAVLMSTKVAGAAATTGVMHYGTANGSGAANTGLTSSSTKSTLLVKNTGIGHGIVADASNANGRGYGVFGTGDKGAGVVGATRGDGPGVRAYAEPGAGGSAVQALTFEASNQQPTISSHQVGMGHAVFAHIEKADNASRALYGRTSGVGHAVLGAIVNAQSPAAATRATTQGSGAGLEAVSAKGVGATFEGKTAQVELVPSSESSHPSSGAPGQLFVDSGKRLWFCRGGNDWQQLA